MASVDFVSFQNKLESTSMILVIFFNFLFVSLWWFLALPIPVYAVAVIVVVSMGIQWFVVRPSMARTIENMKQPKKS